MATEIKHVKGNALDYAELDGHCMIHVCNNKGGFGGGKTAIATQVANRWPLAKENYISSGYFLGSVSTNVVLISEDKLSVINMVAQDGYGSRWKGIKYFKEDAFIECLNQIKNHNHVIKTFYKVHTIVVPYRMGADRAGGDWDWIIGKVEEMLLPHFNILVVEYVG